MSIIKNKRQKENYSLVDFVVQKNYRVKIKKKNKNKKTEREIKTLTLPEK